MEDFASSSMNSLEVEPLESPIVVEVLPTRRTFASRPVKSTSLDAISTQIRDRVQSSFEVVDETS